MPSPVGHSLAAIAVGWAVNRPARTVRDLAIQTGVLTLIGVAPDLDLLWGRHGREFHSIGAAVVVAAVAAWRRWPVGAGTRGRIFAAVLLMWMIHPAMDAFSLDDNPPIGVMLWWPFSSAFVHSPYAFFDPISRYWTSAGTWSRNFSAAAHEIMLLAPFVALVWLVRRRINEAMRQ